MRLHIVLLTQAEHDWYCVNMRSWNIIFLQVQNIDEAKKDYYRGVAMPFQINNVDVTVAANTIYGITAGVLSNIFSITVLDDPIIKVRCPKQLCWFSEKLCL